MKHYREMTVNEKLDYLQKELGLCRRMKTRNMADSPFLSAFINWLGKLNLENTMTHTTGPVTFWGGASSEAGTVADYHYYPMVLQFEENNVTKWKIEFQQSPIKRISHTGEMPTRGEMAQVLCTFNAGNISLDLFMFLAEIAVTA